MPTNITGTESYIGAPGLTMGCWVRFGNAAGALEYVMGKWSDAAGNRSYVIRRDVAGTITAAVSVDGTASVTATSTATPAAATWTYLALRYVPSTSLSIFVYDIPVTNAVGIPASIYVGASVFTIGAEGVFSAYSMTGRLSLCFLCAGALTVPTIKSVYHATKNAFGV